MGNTMKKLVRVGCIMMALVAMIAFGPSITTHAASQSDTASKKTTAIEKASKKDIKTCKANASKYGWNLTTTVKSKTSKKLVTELCFTNSEWGMTIKQVVKKSGKTFTKTYYQGNKKIAFSGIARTLKKYSDV